MMEEGTRYARDVSFERLLIVIVDYQSAELTLDALASLEAEVRALPGTHVTVVENASGDAEVLARGIAERGFGDWVTLDPSPRNGGFAYGNNRAIRPALASDAPPRYVLLLNPDTRIHPGAVEALLAFMDARPDVGIAGSSFENGDGSDWPIAFRFPTILGELDSGLRLGAVSKLLDRWVVVRTMDGREAQVDWLAGASMMIRCDVFRDIGLLDEGYFLYHEETDFCLRARRAGWSCWYVPQSRVVHIGGQSTGVTQRNRRPPRMPTYCFESRRRYFLENHGLAYAIAADVAFGLGFALWRVRRVVQGKPDMDPPHYLGDFWRHSVVLPWNR